MNVREDSDRVEQIKLFLSFVGSQLLILFRVIVASRVYSKSLEFDRHPLLFDIIIIDIRST